jgi:hypothetical protein
MTGKRRNMFQKPTVYPHLTDNITIQRCKLTLRKTLSNENISMMLNALPHLTYSNSAHRGQ